MICVTLFCTLRKSENTRTCENCTRFACNSLMSVCFRVQFSHVRVFSDSRNVQKRATKSHTSGHCLAGVASNLDTRLNFRLLNDSLRYALEGADVNTQPYGLLSSSVWHG